MSLLTDCEVMGLVVGIGLEGIICLMAPESETGATRGSGSKVSTSTVSKGTIYEVEPRLSERLR